MREGKYFEVEEEEQNEEEEVEEEEGAGGGRLWRLMWDRAIDGADLCSSLGRELGSWGVVVVATCKR